MPSRLIHEKEKKVLGELGQAGATCGVGRNLYSVRNGGQPIPRSQVRHIIHGIAHEKLKEARIDPDVEPAERLLESLQKRNASYCCLQENQQD